MSPAGNAFWLVKWDVCVHRSGGYRRSRNRSAPATGFPNRVSQVRFLPRALQDRRGTEESLPCPRALVQASVGAVRVAALAGSSEVLISFTVRDLVAGSGLVFEDAGEHELKGVPDR